MIIDNTHTPLITKLLIKKVPCCKKVIISALGGLLFAALPLGMNQATTHSTNMTSQVTKLATKNSVSTSDLRGRLTEAAPYWAQQDLRSLAAANYLMPTNVSNIEYGTITRQEAAILTARAYHFLQTLKSRQNIIVDSFSSMSSSEMSARANNTLAYEQQIANLMQEFGPELSSLGYGMDSLVTTTKPQDKELHGIALSGEVRYGFMKNSGDEGFNYKISGLRMRLYADANLTAYWKVHTLIESNVRNRFESDVREASGTNNDFKLSRYYLEGNYVWRTMPVLLNIGQESAFLANGTILDSNFKGGILTITPYSGTTISVGRGRVNTNQTISYIEGLKRDGIFDYMGGYYYWNRDKDAVEILYGGISYYYGNYTFTGQYFAANRADGSGTKTGYTGTIRYGKNFSWIKKTYEFDFDYYDLAGTNYVNHTMNGLGNSMNGFRGWSTRVYYTIAKDTMVSLQYYDLEDKTSNKKGRTLWSEISWNFD